MTICCNFINSETNEQIKQGLIRAYADMNDPRARAKLFEIARAAENLGLANVCHSAFGR